MSFLSSAKCERCGGKVPRGRAKEPICDACRDELNLLAEAGREAVRACPLDGSPMSKAIVHMIIVDRCPACRGVWLEGGELEKVLTNASDLALTEMAKGLWIQMP